MSSQQISSAKPSNRITRWNLSSVFFLALAGSLVYLFGPVLFGDRHLAFRDLSHFYTPLYTWLANQPQWFPLWSDLDQSGVSLLGETTTGLFYPLRWVLLSPSAMRFNVGLFMLLHWFLAGWGVLRLSRFCGATIPLALAAAIGYACSGPVFFLYTNPPFLAGAAWLPWAMRCLLDDSPKPWSWRIFDAVPLAMMVLAGDPQTALHVVMVAIWIRVAVLVGHARSESKACAHRRRAISLQFARSVWGESSRFVVVIGMAILFALPQVLGGMDWSRQSWRTWTGPSSLVERAIEPVLGKRDVAVAAMMEDRLEPSLQSQSMRVYDFSVAPWHAAEFILPQVSGRLSGPNERWTNAIPGESRSWTPTLYCGLLAFAIWTLGVLHPKLRSAWWWLALCAFGLACGRFGVGYLVRCGCHWMGAEGLGSDHDATGGLYWWLLMLVPGYGRFRYPARWLPFVALGLCVHGAIVISRLVAQDAKRLTVLFGVVATSCGVLILAIHTHWFSEFANSLQADRSLADQFWGPVVATSFYATVLIAGLHAGLLACCLWFVCSRSVEPCSDKRDRTRVFSARGQWLFALLVLVDSAAIARWQMVSISGQQLVRAGIAASANPELLSPAFPIQNVDWPSAWRAQLAGPSRSIEVASAQRRHLFGRWYLADRIHVVNQAVTQSPAAWTAMQREMQSQLALLPGDEQEAATTALARFWRCRSIEIAVAESTGEDSGTRWQPVKGALAEVGWVEDYRVASMPQDVATLRQQAQEIVTEVVSRRDRVAPKVFASTQREWKALRENWPTRNGTNVDFPESATRPEMTWRKLDPQQLEVSISTDRPGLLTWMQYQDGNWIASIQRKGREERRSRTYCVDLIAQGIPIEPGEYTVVFRYEPAWYPVSLVVSGLGWCVLISLLAVRIFRRRDRAGNHEAIARGWHRDRV